ncbi:hypothetical protein B0H14DRAFT_2378293 [Mycena olivaceomarginata]|nr:hypothetical protein B0H14DRAFT_2378293 [Mycena olivaceomarginata]
MPPLPSTSASLRVPSSAPAVLPPVSQAVQVAMVTSVLLARTSATVLGPCPPDVPTWFVDTCQEMLQTELGCHFNALLAAWTRIEDASRFEQGLTNLPHKGRPRQVGNWVNSSHGKKLYDALIPDIGQYALTWQKWWDSLQPTWRKRGKDGMSTAEGGREWGPWYQWGVNGTLNIVVSLYFWGVAIVGNPDSDLKVWEAGVADVTWMLEGMAVYYELFKKKF